MKFPRVELVDLPPVTGGDGAALELKRCGELATLLRELLAHTSRYDDSYAVVVLMTNMF